MWVSDVELADLLGRDAARIFTRTLGGQCLYVPAKADASHRIACIIGLRCMEILCASYGGENITIPNGREKNTARRRAIQMLQQGHSLSRVANACEITQRYAEMIAQELRAQQRSPVQGSLLG